MAGIAHLLACDWSVNGRYCTPVVISTDRYCTPVGLWLVCEWQVLHTCCFRRQTTTTRGVKWRQPSTTSLLVVCGSIITVRWTSRIIRRATTVISSSLHTATSHGNHLARSLLNFNIVSFSLNVKTLRRKWHVRTGLMISYTIKTTNVVKHVYYYLII